jgi:predicted ATPase
VVDEQATQIIKEGKVLPWVDRDAFQQEVLRRQLAVESPHVGCLKPVFFDRGLFDGEAYYIADGLPIPQAFTGLSAGRYMLALLIEELPFFDNNGVRFEDLDFTRRFTPIVENCYTSRGVAVERVPALPPEERTDLVLKIVEKHAQRVSVAAAMPAALAPVNLAFAG